MTNIGAITFINQNQNSSSELLGRAQALSLQQEKAQMDAFLEQEKVLDPLAALHETQKAKEQDFDRGDGKRKDKDEKRRKRAGSTDADGSSTDGSAGSADDSNGDDYDEYDDYYDAQGSLLQEQAPAVVYHELSEEDEEGPRLLNIEV